MKQFVEALDHDGWFFQYISKKMPALSTEKLKAVCLDGPKINDIGFVDSMNNVESSS